MGARTCNLPHGVEDFQLLWVKRWDFVERVAVTRGQNENPLDWWGWGSNEYSQEMPLPFDASHQEVQTALNLGAVYKTVDVQSIYSLPGCTSCPVTSWGTMDKKEKTNMESASRNGIHRGMLFI